MKSGMLIGIVSLIVLVGCKNEDIRPESVRPVFYQEAGSFHRNDTMVSSGVIQSATEAKLSFKVGGLIGKVFVDMGDTVQRGAVIARLDATDYQIQLDRASASLKNAEAQLETARSAFARVGNLYVNNHVSLSDYEKARLQADFSESMLKTARSQWEAARNQLEYTVLRAPFDGVVTAVMARENEMTGAGLPIVLVATAQQLEFKTTLPEKMIGQITRGADVTVSLHSIPGQTFRGYISEVSPGVSSASSFPVIVRLTGDVKGLLPGMTGSVEIPLERNQGDSEKLVVTVDAVGHDKEGDYVYVASDSNEGGVYVARKRLVSLGELLPEGYEILHGLEQDEKVITAGLSFLYDGRKVKLLDAEE